MRGKTHLSLYKIDFISYTVCLANISSGSIACTSSVNFCPLESRETLLLADEEIFCVSAGRFSRRELYGTAGCCGVLAIIADIRLWMRTHRYGDSLV